MTTATPGAAIGRTGRIIAGGIARIVSFASIGPTGRSAAIVRSEWFAWSGRNASGQRDSRRRGW